MNTYQNVRNTLEPIYGNARFPVIFVSKDIKVVYANQFAYEQYPEFCYGKGPRRFISAQSSAVVTSALERGKPIKVLGEGVKGFISFSFIPCGGILDGKCAIMHLEENKEMLKSMSAEIASLEMGERSAETMAYPVKKMRFLLDKLENSETIMSDKTAAMAVPLLEDCLQEFTAYVRDYRYALKMVNRTSDAGMTVFALGAYMNMFCKTHEGVKYLGSCDPKKLIICRRADLADMLDMVLMYIAKAAPSKSLTADVKGDGDRFTFIVRGRKCGGKAVEFDSDGLVAEKLERARKIAEKYEGSVAVENKKTVLTVTVKMKSALVQEAGNYLHVDPEELI